MKRFALLMAASSFALGSFGDIRPATAASEIDALQAQIEALARQVEDLKRAQAAAEAKAAKRAEKAKDTGNKVLAKGSPGTFIIPGTNTEFHIGGYVKGDAIYDLSEDAGGDLFFANSISTGDANDESSFSAHARQSRLRVRTKTPTQFGDLKTLLEGDFFNTEGNEVISNSAGLRLRHAWGELGNWGVGQFWTNFMPIESYPATVDFNGPAGLPFIRQVQVRYTQNVSDNFKWTASLENSEFDGRGIGFDAANPTRIVTIGETTGFGGLDAGFDVAPDATFAATYFDDWGLVKLAGVGRILGNPNGGDEFGWGVNLSGNAKLWPGGKVNGSFSYGDGIGRYILNGVNNDGFIDATGDLETIEAYGLNVGVTQKVADNVTVGLQYGRYESLDTFAAGDIDTLNTVHATVFYKPLPRVTLGGEVIYGDREDQDGDDDDAVRLQTSLQVNF